MQVPQTCCTWTSMTAKKPKVFVQLPVTQRDIFISNSVARSAQGLSLAEKRIVFLALAQLGGVKRSVKLHATEYARIFGVDNDTAYTQLREAAKNLFHRYVRFNHTDGKDKGLVEYFHWVESFAYKDSEGFATLDFTSKISPFLFQLKDEFTKYRLEQAGALRSLHSWRLLELLSQMQHDHGSGWLVIDIDDFHHAMESPDSYRKNFNLLKVRVIEPAIKELNEKDNWAIDWEPLKRGRKVAVLRFNFKRDPQERLF